jgi:1-acyl-sn-glycerol-3-phosphate acyltransferase
VQYLIAPLRAMLLVPHILLGLSIAFLVFPLCRTQATRNRINHWWSRWVLRLCGASLKVSGQRLSDELASTGITPGKGRMLLSNHISWIDIFAINAAMPCRFVAKAEIVRWPIIGGMVAHSGTLFIERGRRRAVATVNEAVQGYLRAGESIGVFPEGTTTRGDRLLPFHSNLMAPALEVDCPVWPVALRYTEQGRFSDAAAFVGDMGLVVSLARMLVAKDLEIEMAILPALEASAYENRHTLARAAHAALSEYFGLVEVPERAEAPDNGMT